MEPKVIQLPVSTATYFLRAIYAAQTYSELLRIAEHAARELEHVTNEARMKGLTIAPRFVMEAQAIAEGLTTQPDDALDAPVPFSVLAG